MGYEMFRHLGEVPETVLATTQYSFSKFKKGRHLNNAEFLYSILGAIKGIDTRYLDYCKIILNLLQQPILEVDDRLDKMIMGDEEVLASETIKLINPALFFNSLLKYIKNEESPQRFLLAGEVYLKEIGKLLHTPVQYVQNTQEYLKTINKHEELDKLANVQILKGSHLRVYFFPTSYILDSQPAEVGLEKLAQSMERTRGIELLTKDIDDLYDDRQTGSYNSLNLISHKHKLSPNSEFVKKDMESVGRLLMEQIKNLTDNGYGEKYEKAGRVIYAQAQIALSNLEKRLNQI